MSAAGVSGAVGDDLDAWRCALDGLGRRAPAFSRTVCLRETTSTQDAARSIGAEAGTLVVAWRQTAGRGRLGRAWADTGAEGVALTAALPAGPAPRLALAGAVAAAWAVEAVLAQAATAVPPGARAAPLRPGLKWPNDVMLEKRKLAGVLIECADAVALVGIGVNVAQRSWPSELGQIAVSLAQAGVEVARISVIIALAEALSRAWAASDAELVREFRQLDCLRGTHRRLRCGGERVSGTIVEIDPLSTIVVRTDQGERVLPAATTHVER